MSQSEYPKFEKPGFDFLMDSKRRLAGLPPVKPKRIPTIEELYESEWSKEFEQLMRNRLVMGYFRYEPMDAPPNANYDRVAGAHRRLDMYLATGNTEFLVDVANFSLLEFVKGLHPNKHFRSIDDGEHLERRTKRAKDV